MLMDHRLRVDHERIRLTSDRMEILLRDGSPADLEELMMLRRDIRLSCSEHLRYERDILYDPLSNHPCELIRARVARLQTELEDLLSRSRSHTKRWTADEVLRRWDEYSIDAMRLINEMRGRMQREEEELHSIPGLKHQDQVPADYRSPSRRALGSAVLHGVSPSTS